MDWFTAFVLYVLIWWTVLFAVLPFGTRPVADPDSQTGWRGAPANPRMGRKILVTTLVSVLLWGGCQMVIQSGWVTFRSGILALPDD